MCRRSLVPGAALGAAVLCFLVLQLPAGPLDPPAGPVVSSRKTLGEVKPRITISTPVDADSAHRITTWGSYHLVADVTAPSGKAAIEVDLDAAPEVTIDLNGFALRGATGSTLIESCRIEENQGDGICAATDSTFRNDRITLAGVGMANAAASHVSGSANRIEGKNCTQSDPGIDFDAGGKCVVCNSCSVNSVHCDVAADDAGNVYQALAFGVISGDSGGITPAAKDPQANVPY
ncbi:MAG: hypothetical protein DYG94_03020 [Leptolyngbya sp. PLA3]|nr:MAG: hypothetical protein EDM82_11280 [Cyanobacteria bacterium CYA]MCE7967701.1 hypothetical protein [Leptolyngbya sp. PL-A3]